MLRVSLFGEQTITDELTGSVRSRSWRTVALLAFLVLHVGSPQARQRIAGVFWPDSTERQALTNLRRELHELRRVLGDEPSLLVTSRDLCWQDTATCRVDVRQFVVARAAALAASKDDERLVEYAASALEEYRGEFLPGRFEDWILEARSELEGHCVELCDLLTPARAAVGDPTGALEVAGRRVALRPLEEAGYRTLMELQADLGDRGGAVSTYHHCVSVLERELGVDPDPATRRVMQRLLAREGREDEERQEAPGLSDERAGYAGARLVGRLRELALLDTAWQTAVAAGPRLTLVRGDAGVGKTRLVAEVADRVEGLHGAVVATTRCFGTAGSLPLAPVADWLRHPVVRSAVERLDPVWQAEVDRLVPAGADRIAEAGPRGVVAAWQRHRFFEGLARALTGVGRPMLLVLDNVQWCDQETLAFLTFALGMAGDAPLMVAATLRDDEPDEGNVIADWTARMRATGILAELALHPLEVADTARLAEAISGRRIGDDETSLLHATTGGFPLYVVEAMRSTASPGASPWTAGDLPAVLHRRLGQASPAAREVAGLAAAVGRNVGLDLLTEASDLDDAEVVLAVDELWRRRILREIGDGYEFSHDLLRDAAYAQVSPPRRWLLHRRVAQALELLHAGDTDPVSAQLAEQHASGGRPGRAIPYYRLAAAVAAARFAHTEAIRLNTAALDALRMLPEARSRDVQELSVLEDMAAPLNAAHGYASTELQRAIERSLELAEALGHRDSAFTALIAQWASLQVQGRIADGYRLASRALATVAPDSEQGGIAHFAVGGAAFSRGRLTEAAHHLGLAATLVGSADALSVGTRPAPHARAWAAHAHLLLGHDVAAAQNCHEAIALAREMDHPYSLAAALAYAGMTHQMRQDRSALAEAVGEARDLCDRHGFAYYREWVLVLDAWARDDGSSINDARRGIENLRSDGALNRMPYWLSMLADLLIRHDRPGPARATLDAALAGGHARDDLWWLPEVMRLRAALDGGQEEAVARLRSAARTASAHGSVTLLDRCERDLHRRGVRAVPPIV